MPAKLRLNIPPPPDKFRQGFNTIAIPGDEIYENLKVGDLLELANDDRPVYGIVTVLSLDLVNRMANLTNSDIVSNYLYRNKAQLLASLIRNYPGTKVSDSITIIGFDYE